MTQYRFTEKANGIEEFYIQALPSGNYDYTEYGSYDKAIEQIKKETEFIEEFCTEEEYEQQIHDSLYIYDRDELLEDVPDVGIEFGYIEEVEGD